MCNHFLQQYGYSRNRMIEQSAGTPSQFRLHMPPDVFLADFDCSKNDWFVACLWWNLEELLISMRLPSSTTGPQHSSRCSWTQVATLSVVGKWHWRIKGKWCQLLWLGHARRIHIFCSGWRGAMGSWYLDFHSAGKLIGWKPILHYPAI